MTRRRVVNAIADGFLTGVVIGSLIVANAPTWGWIGFGWLTWYVLKVMDWQTAQTEEEKDRVYPFIPRKGKP